MSTRIFFIKRKTSRAPPIKGAQGHSWTQIGLRASNRLKDFLMGVGRLTFSATHLAHNYITPLHGRKTFTRLVRIIPSLVNSFIILRSKHPQSTKGGLWGKILKGCLWYVAS